MDIGRYIDPWAGPPGSNVRPPPRRGPVAWVVAAVVVALTVAFLVANRGDDVPLEDPPSDTTVTRSAP